MFDNPQLSGLGLDSLLKGIVAATVSVHDHTIYILLIFVTLQGLDKIYSGLGLGKWLNPGKK